MLSLAALMLTSVVGAGLEPQCAFGASESIVEVAPGPSETGLPRNLSIWFRVRNLETLPLGVRLSDVANDRNISLREEVAMSWHPTDGMTPREGAYRFTPIQLLEAGHTYALSWRSTFGNDEGHIFVVGNHIADTPPADPTGAGARNVASVRCGEDPSVQVSAAHQSVFLLASVDGEVRGFARGDVVAAFLDGAAGAPVVGEVVSMDIAGNRSVGAAAFTATTPQVSLPPERDTGGCSSVRGGGTLGVWLVLAAWVGRRARRARDAAPSVLAAS